MIRILTRLKSYIFILFALVISVSDVLPDDTYPYSYKRIDYQQGGEILIVGGIDQKNQYSFFIKPNWAEESEAVYIKRGIIGDNFIGSTLGNAYILSAMPIKHSVLSCWKEEDKVYVSVIDTIGAVKSITEVFGEWNKFEPIEAKWYGQCGQNDYLLIINKNLFVITIDKVNRVSSNLFSDNVEKAVSLYNSNQPLTSPSFAYVYSKEGYGFLYFVKKTKSDKFATQFLLTDDIYLFPFSSRVILLTSSKSYNISLLNLIDPEKGSIYESLIEASGERVVITDNDKKYIYYLELNRNGSDYSLVVNDYSNLKNIVNINTTRISKDLIEPIGLWHENGQIIAMFRNGLATFDLDGTLNSIDYIPFGEAFNIKPNATLINNNLVFSSAIGSMILERTKNELWFLNRFLQNSAYYLIPTILIIIAIVFIKMYNNQKRVLKALINLPSTGVVFVLNQNGRLKSANSYGKQLLGITDSVPFNKLFAEYCILEHTKSIKELVDKAIELKDFFTQKINIIKNNDLNEWIYTSYPLRSFSGRFKGLVITGVDITEQLERQRLSNWAQLAHDMQTNLSTIRLNAEQLELEKEINKDRRKKIIHQVGLLIQRVRDVVTVGRNESIYKATVDCYDLCYDAINEFDATLYPNINFLVEAEHYNVSCDKPKILRALRNAIENSIKSFQQSNGTITISNSSDSKYVYISVKDNGPGMDANTKSKFTQPYFTTSKKNGGYGIGTMIMQHVMELHGGELKIDSEKGKGTEIVFCIPNYLPNKTIKAISQKKNVIHSEN